MPPNRGEVLVVGDDVEFNEAVIHALHRANYHARAIRGMKRGLAEARQAPADVLILEGGPDEELASLEQGIDSFLAKPCSVRVLVARVRALLRLHRGTQQTDGDLAPTRLTFPGVVIDGARHEVIVDGLSVALTAAEFRLLHFLASGEGRVFTRDRLVSVVAGEFSSVIDRNIDVHVGAIRRSSANAGACSRPFAAWAIASPASDRSPSIETDSRPHGATRRLPVTRTGRARRVRRANSEPHADSA